VIATYDDYPEVLRNALVSIEDKDFYRHSGINIWRIVGAAYRDVESGGRVQGASTLTMQLARNLFLSPDRSFYRKVQEALLAIQIERRFTKPQIFTLYANQIFLGHGAYGFEAASEYYFSKPAKQLKLEEAALLAGLPKAPQYYSPITHPERAVKRRNLVLNAMLEDGKITAAQAAGRKEQADPSQSAERSEFAGSALCGRNPALPRSEVWQRPGSRKRDARLHIARYGSAEVGAPGAARRPRRLRAPARLARQARECDCPGAEARHLRRSGLGGRARSKRIHARAGDTSLARRRGRPLRAAQGHACEGRGGMDEAEAQASRHAPCRRHCLPQSARAGCRGKIACQPGTGFRRRRRARRHR